MVDLFHLGMTPEQVEAERLARTAAAEAKATEHVRQTERKLPKFEANKSYEAYAANGNTAGFVDSDDHECCGMHEGPHECECYPDRAKNAGEAGEATESEDPQAAFEKRVDKVLTCVGSQNSLREIFYKVMRFCQDPHDFSEVEDFITNSDEKQFSHIYQTPYELIMMLIRAEGLEQTAYDIDYVEVTPERTEGLTEDEVDDLIELYTLKTTEAGIAACDLITPEKRMETLLAQRPHRRDTFLQLLEFCETPRKFPEIQEWYKTTPGLAVDKVQTHHTLAADFYVDKLEKAGALVWRGAWITTDAGRGLLAQADRDLEE